MPIHATLGAWLSLVERLVRDQEVASSNLVAPTFFRKRPFGEKVEGLSHFAGESCGVEPAVQTHDFENAGLAVVIVILLKRLPFARAMPSSYRLRLLGDSETSTSRIADQSVTSVLSGRRRIPAARVSSITPSFP